MKFPPWWGYGYFLELHNQRFNQIAKFLRLVTPQNKLYCFSEKKFLGLGAL